MKTPEEIKKGLALCMSAGSYNYPCEECPYVNEEDGCKTMMEDELALIQQLEAQNAELVRKTDKLQSSMGQVEKALQDNGFLTMEELLEAYDQVKNKLEEAVDALAERCEQCRSNNTMLCAICKGSLWKGRGKKKEEKKVYGDYKKITILEQVDELKKKLLEELKELKKGVDEEKMEWVIRAEFDEDGIPRLSVGYTLECEGE